MKSIVRSWACRLTLRQQATLLSAIRGCDGAPRDDPSKEILRYLRFCVLEPSEKPGTGAFERSTFMRSDAPYDVARAFVASMDHYPLHFVTHLMHAAQVIAYESHAREAAKFFGELYATMCAALHVWPEDILGMRERLRRGNNETSEQG